MAILEAASKAGRSGGDFLPIVLVRRSTVELEAGRPGQAGDDALRALKQLQAASPDGMLSSNIGRAYLNLGRALQAQGKPNEARAAFRSAAENLQATLGPDSPDTRSARRMAESGNPESIVCPQSRFFPPACRLFPPFAISQVETNSSGRLLPRSLRRAEQPVKHSYPSLIRVTTR